MKRFCTKCGKKIEDGKTCDCVIKEAKYEEKTQKKEVKNDSINIIDCIIEFVKKPLDTTRKYMNIQNNESYILLLITSLIISIVFVPFKCCLSLFVLNTFTTFIAFLALAAMIVIISRLVSKQVEFNDVVKIVSLSSIFFIPFSILGLLLCYISPAVYMLMLISAGFLFSINVCNCLKEYTNLDHNKIPYLYLASVLCLLLLMLMLI